MSHSADSHAATQTMSHAAPKPQNRELVSASLRMLAMRDMSRMQFVQKLSAKAFASEEIGVAVAWCEAEGWLNEARYADVTARRLGQKYGASRISHTLRQKGVNDLAIAETVAILRESELARALRIWSRRFAAIPDSADARVKQTRYLQSRGFSFDVIKQILSGQAALA